MSNIAPTASTAPGTTAPEPATGPAGTAPAADASAAPAATEAPSLEQLQAELNTWKGHARTWEDRAKENKTAREQLDALEAAKLTETQRLQKELDELKAVNATANAKAERDALVAGVATAKGVPAALLAGATQAELEAEADALLAFRGEVKAPTNDASASGTQGAPITAGAQILSRDTLKGMTPVEIRQAKVDGRLNTLMGIK